MTLYIKKLVLAELNHYFLVSHLYTTELIYAILHWEKFEEFCKNDGMHG